MELAITQPFFELQIPDFVWKFIWTVPTKLATLQRKIGMESMQENSMDHGISYNSAIFELDNQHFAWKFVWTIQKNGHPNFEQNANLQQFFFKCKKHKKYKKLNIKFGRCYRSCLYF